MDVLIKFTSNEGSFPKTSQTVLYAKRRKALLKMKANVSSDDSNFCLFVNVSGDISPLFRVRPPPTDPTQKGASKDGMPVEPKCVRVLLRLTV